jgi:hypothetical protein
MAVRRPELRRPLLLAAILLGLSGQAAPGIWWEGRWAAESAWCSAAAARDQRPVRLTRSELDLGESLCRVDRIGRLEGGVRLAATCRSHGETAAAPARIDIRRLPDGIELSGDAGRSRLNRCPL